VFMDICFTHKEVKFETFVWAVRNIVRHPMAKEVQA